MIKTYFDFFSPFKIFVRLQRDTLLFFRMFIDMQIKQLDNLLEESRGEKEEKKEVKKVEIK